MIPKLSVLTLCILGFLTNSLIAVTHYVSKTGSNLPPYTSWATAADSIQKAVDVSVSGDTVRVGSGVYAESLILSNGVYLIGSGIDSTTIDGRGIAQYLIQTSDTNWIEGFWIRVIGPGSVGILFGGFAADSFVVIQNNKITDAYQGVNGAWGTMVIRNNILENNDYGVYCVIQSDVIIENNYFENNTTGIFVGFNNSSVNSNVLTHSYLEGISGVSCSEFVAANNIVYGIEKNSLYAWGIVNEGLSGDKGTIINNTVVGTTGQGMGIEILTDLTTGADSQIVKNNIVTNFKVGIATSVRSWEDPEISYNDLWNNAESLRIFDSPTGGLDSGNIFLDPMFVNDTSDFHLQFASPCIDAGDPTILDPDSSRSDIGAYGGLLGEIYVYQDLAPDVPESLQASSESTHILLTWKPNTESDLLGYVVYKDSFPGFPADSFHSIAVVPKDSSLYSDPNWTLNQTYYYRVAAFDTLNHLSSGSPEIMVMATDVKQIEEPRVGQLPTDYTLYQNYPNPFNPTTTIVYFLPNVGPQPAQVDVLIYNVLGERVRTLVNSKQAPGFYQVTWDGKDDDGIGVSTGVYFCSLKIWGRLSTESKKLVLIK